MRPETMEKAIAVAGTASSCAALLATVAFLFGNVIAVVPAAAGIIVTAICAGALVGIHIGRLMAAPVVVVGGPAGPVVASAGRVPAGSMAASGVAQPAPVIGPSPPSPRAVEPIVFEPPAEGTFEMTGTEVRQLRQRCAEAHPFETPTVEIDTSGITRDDLEHLCGTVPMRPVTSGGGVELLEW